ncbi:transposase [Tabrizicola caldifontis]|uniref:transposase n=1 Tax=Tabrizicola caldifontis TaxID=2528036 RepID=UPI001080AA89
MAAGHRVEGLPSDPFPPSRQAARVGWMRRVLGGISRVLRTGASWRDLSQRNALRTTIHKRFKRWAIAGVWVQAFETLADRHPDSMQVIADSIIRAHQSSVPINGPQPPRRDEARPSV